MSKRIVITLGENENTLLIHALTTGQIDKKFTVRGCDKETQKKIECVVDEFGKIAASLYNNEESVDIDLSKFDGDLLVGTAVDRLFNFLDWVAFMKAYQQTKNQDGQEQSDKLAK